MPATLTDRYTREEFLAELARRGYERTPRWHEEWVERGLQSHGERTDRRKAATWPQEQLELAASLLHQRERGAHLTSLANIVVWIWLWWGEPYVPLSQIPRALRYWVEGQREPAFKHVRASARDLVQRIAHPRGTGRKRLEKTLIELTYRPEDPESIRELFDDVFDPERTGDARGPSGAALTTDAYVRMVRIRMEARQQLSTFTDDEYLRARELYLDTRTEYARLQPAYARDPDFGHFYEPSDVNELANSACSDLLTCLRMSRELATRPRSKGAYVPRSRVESERISGPGRPR